MKKTILILVLIFLTGCSNPYQKFYTDKTGGIDISKHQSVAVSNGPVVVSYGGDIDKDSFGMLENNFALVGISNFTGDNISDDGVMDQAESVHASHAIIYRKSLGIRTNSVPILLPNTTTSNTTSSGTISNNYGENYNYSGTSSTTNYGNRTVYVPQQIERSENVVTYWVKRKPPFFGIQSSEVPENIKSELGSNRGLNVLVVIKDSPAFYADIMKNDTIMKIGDTDIYGILSFEDAVVKNLGKKTKVLIYRNGKEIEKDVSIAN